MSNISFINQFLKVHQDLKAAQAQSKEKNQSTLKKSKPPQYDLTSKEAFEKQKVALLDAVKEATTSDSVIDKPALFAKYLAAGAASTTIERCSAMVAVNSLSPKALDFLCLFPFGFKFKESCKVKQMLFLARLTLLDQAAQVLPAANQVIFRKNINNFVDACCSLTIVHKAFNDAVDKVPNDLWEEFIKLLPKNPEIHADPKYAFIQDLDAPVSTFIHSVNQQFRHVYSTYKSVLSLLRTTVELVDLANYTTTFGMLSAKIHAPLGASLVVFSDVHYFLCLVRSFRQGPLPTDLYPMPLFSDAEGFTTILHPSEVVFTLRTEAASVYGFSEEHLPSLSNSWYRLNNALSLFQKYKSKVNYISYFIYICYFICWFSIVKLFFYCCGNIGETAWPFILFKRISIVSRPLIARDARYLKEQTQNWLAQQSKGKHSPGHPVYGEMQPNDEYHAEGSLTKGAGSNQNPSKPLLLQPIDPRVNKKEPQNHIPFEEPIVLPPGSISNPIPGSQQALEAPEVKNKLDHKELSEE